MDKIGVHLEIIDLFAIGVILFFFILGIFKGFVMQVVRLLTFLIALAVATRYAGPSEDGTGNGLSGYLISWFPNHFGNNNIAVYVAYFLIFIAIFIIGTLIGHLLKSILKRLHLGAYDRLLGGCLGIAVGAVCVIVIVSSFVFISPESEFATKISDSHTARLSTKAVGIAKPFFPEELHDKMNKVIQSVPSEKSETK